MKKLKLKALELGASELLTREQLKNIMGAFGTDGCLEPGSFCTFGGTLCCGRVSYCNSNQRCVLLDQ